MAGFYLNGIYWRVSYVDPYDKYLVDRTKHLRLATTDVRSHHIRINEDIEGELLTKVLLHEIGHATMASYGLLDELHRFVKREYWVESEEWVCNLIAEYGALILHSAYEALGDKVWDYIPSQIDRMLS